ncbi:putative membrane protein YeiH [Burkholderia sp. 132550021-2]
MRGPTVSGRCARLPDSDQGGGHDPQQARCIRMAAGRQQVAERRVQSCRRSRQPDDAAPRLSLRMKRIEQVVLAADLAGTAVFAIEGANAAIGAGLDLFGVMVLSLVVALGGGVIRDLLIGARPPSAVSDWRYPALAFASGLFAFVFHERVAAFSPSLLTTLDAAGLALFAVAGAVKALEFRVHPFIATLMGAVTGCGGGVVRDVLLARIPVVLVTDIYASAALLGAVVVVSCRRLGCSPIVAAVLGGAACFALRMTAVRFGWQLPKIAGGA